MEKKAKQGIMWYSAELASFLFKCAWKTLFLGFRAEILLLCAELLPLLRFVQKYYWPGTRGSLDSRAGPFLGSVKKYWFFGEIFTSALTQPNTVVLHASHGKEDHIIYNSPTIMNIRTKSPQKLYNGSSFYSKVLSFFPIEKFLTSNPQSKIPFVQALNIDHFNVISTTKSRISTISLCSFFCFNGR